MGKRGSELIQVIQKKNKRSLLSNFFASTHYSGWQSHLKIGDLVCWHLTLDHVVLKSEIGKIAVGEFCTVCVCVYIYIYGR